MIWGTVTGKHKNPTIQILTHLSLRNLSNRFSNMIHHPKMIQELTLILKIINFTMNCFRNPSQIIKRSSISIQERLLIILAN